MRTLKIPPSWKCDWQITTLIAVAAGIGAAVGCALLPWWVLLLLLPLTVTLDRGQLTAAGVAFTVCLLSGIIQSAVADKEKARLSGHDAVVSGTAVCFDRRASALEALPRPATLNCEIRCGGETFPAAVIFPGKERIFYGDRFTIWVSMHTVLKTKVISLPTNTATAFSARRTKSASGPRKCIGPTSSSCRTST